MSKTVSGLHYCPDNGWFGDAMPIYHDGTYHIYFNKPFREDQTEFRGGWGHIATKDFITFTEYPDAFLYENKADGMYIGNPVNSGCVFYGEGKWHAFYAGYPEYSSNIFIRHAVSDDGISFRYIGEAFERPLKWYRADNNFRDPAVIWDNERKEYHMVFCAKGHKTADGPNYFSGTVGHAVSKDLYHWECLPPMPIEGVANTMECPEIYFDEKYKRWVMLYYYHETRIRTSDNPMGPWERGKVLSPDNFDFMAGRRMTDGERQIMIGWISRKDRFNQRIPCRCMLFPRELRLLDDGRTPATRFIREIEQLFHIPNFMIVPEKMQPGSTGWHTDGVSISVDRPNGGTMAGWRDLPGTSYMQIDFTVTDPTGQIHFLLGTEHGGWSGDPDTEWTDTGVQLIVDLPTGLLRLREHYEWDQKDEIALLPYRFTAGEVIHLEILRDGEILEVGVNGEQTMVAVIPDCRAGNFGISVQDTALEIHRLSVFETKKKNTHSKGK
ncbi:MAG: hypothetical protein IJ302_02635 [Clostridia bacterium]|nr:hypothetical protein [Clostridia bacterium]